jgi:DNA-binding NarL/FixJ family response regulator
MTRTAFTVLIAEDHPVFRDGLCALVGALDGGQVVAEAANGDDAVEQALAVQPDVIVMDLNLPGTNGVEATRRIVTASPHVRVLVLTMFDDEDSVFAAMRAGARGYLLKDADQAEIARAIEAVADGEAIFGPAVATRVLAYFASSGDARGSSVFPNLTEREHEVLELVAQGHANAAIAWRLGLSEKTIRNHVSNIFTKLQVADRAQAIVRAREAGLGTTGRSPADGAG